MMFGKLERKANMAGRDEQLRKAMALDYRQHETKVGHDTYVLTQCFRE